MVYNTNTSLSVYHDGVEYYGTGSSFTSGSYMGGNGDLIIGRLHVNDRYTSGTVMADELKLFNTKLSSNEVETIFNVT